MPRRLLDDHMTEPISPLIDVVVNGLAAIFIFLMIYIAVMPPGGSPPEPIKFLTGITLPPAICGQNYIYTLPVTGGQGRRTFKLDEENLPGNLKFDAESGTVYGIPMAGETACKDKTEFSLSVTVTDQATQRDTTSVKLTVHPTAVPFSPNHPPFEISRQGGALPTGRVGLDYEQVIGAVGGVEPYSWRIVGGSLPPGIDFENGRLWGKPRAEGAYRFEVEADYSRGEFTYEGHKHVWAAESRRRELQLDVVGGLLHTLHLPAGRVGEPYLASVVSGQRLPGERVEWSADVEGLTPSPDEGVLRGTPSKAGDYKVSYEIKTSEQKLGGGSGTLRILPPRPERSVASGQIEAKVGEGFKYAVPYRGMQGIVTVSALGELPLGLTLSGEEITGTPSQIGLARIPLKAEDESGNTATGDLTIRIRPRTSPLTINLPDAVNLIVGQQSRVPFGASGGEGDFEWTLSGSLPTGLQLQGNHLEGVLSAPGLWPVIIAVRDRSTGETARRSVSLRAVYPEEARPTLLSTTVPAAIIGKEFDFTPAAAGGVGPLRYQFAGSLPRGLVFEKSKITGVPEALGEAEFEVTVTDEVGQRDGPRRYKLQVEGVKEGQPRTASLWLGLAILFTGFVVGASITREIIIRRMNAVAVTKPH